MVETVSGGLARRVKFLRIGLLPLRVVRGGLVAVLAMAGAVALSPAAQASDPPSPLQPTATFDGWTSGTDNVTVSWQPIDGADHYNVTYRPGDFDVDTIGSNPQLAPVADDATSVSAPLPLPLTAGDVTFMVQASGPAISQTQATVTLTIPGPTFTSLAVSGVVGQATLSWSGVSDGDSLVLRRGTTSSPSTPTDGTSVALADGGSEVLQGLTGPADLSMFEVGPDGPTDYSPPVTVQAVGAPAADVGPQIADLRGPDDDPSTPNLIWHAPAGCTNPAPLCDRSVVLLKTGTVPSTDPTDGRLIYSQSLSQPIVDDGVRLDGIAVGTTYTVTVFNIGMLKDGTVIYSPPASVTWTAKAVPGVALVASPPTGTALGQNVTLTVTVDNSFVTPTGTVKIFDEKRPICGPVTVPASGVVTCHTTTQKLVTDLGAGAPGQVAAGLAQAGWVHITGEYSGDGNVQGLSANIYYDVTKAVPSVAVSTGSAAAQPTVVATVRLKGVVGAPTGKIGLALNGKTLCRNVKLHKGLATCRISHKKLSRGKHKLVVTYSGDHRYKHRQTTATVKIH